MLLPNHYYYHLPLTFPLTASNSALRVVVVASERANERAGERRSRERIHNKPSGRPFRSIRQQKRERSRGATGTTSRAGHSQWSEQWTSGEAVGGWLRRRRTQRRQQPIWTGNSPTYTMGPLLQGFRASDQCSQCSSGLTKCGANAQTNIPAYTLVPSRQTNLLSVYAAQQSGHRSLSRAPAEDSRAKTNSLGGACVSTGRVACFTARSEMWRAQAGQIHCDQLAPDVGA